MASQLVLYATKGLFRILCIIFPQVFDQSSELVDLGEQAVGKALHNVLVLRKGRGQ